MGEIGKEGEEGQEGRGREEEVNCHAQLKQGRWPDFNRFRVIHQCDGQTDRQTGNSIGL